MPTVVSYIAAHVALAAVNTVAFLSGTALGNALAFVALDAGLRALSRKDRPEADDSRDVMVRSSIAPKKIVYGEALVSGPVFYTNAGGTRNQDLYVVIGLAGHEVEDITDVWLDGTKIASSDINWATDGKVSGGDYQDYVWFWKRLGTSTQVSVTQLRNAFSDITTAHRGRGLCYLTARFRWQEESKEVFEAGAPQSIRALVKGRKVYDPRLDSTVTGGSGSHRVNDSTTWEYSSNPALCVADYMIDDDLGMAIDPSQIDYESLIDEADHCDASVTLPSGTETRFTCNGVLLTTDTHRDNLRKLLSAMNGRLSRTNGKFVIQAGRYIAPSISADESWLRGDIQVKPAIRRADRFNTIKALFIDPEHSYKSTESLSVTDSNYVSRDNGETLRQEITLPMTNSETMAQRICFKQLNQTDQQKVVVMPCNYKAMQVKIHDFVQLTIDELSWTDKVFRVINWRFNDIEGEGGIDLTLREDSSGAYADPESGDYSTRTAAGTVTFATPGVPAPSSLSATAKDGGILVEWTLPKPSDVWDRVKVFASQDSDWANASEVYSGRASNFFHTLLPGETRYYWVRAVTDVGESDRDPDSDTSSVTATATSVLSSTSTNLIQDPIGIHRDKYWLFVDADTWQLQIDDEGAYWDRGTWTGTDTSTLQQRAQFWVRIDPTKDYVLSAEANLSGRSAGNLVVDILTFPSDKTASELDDLAGIVWDADTTGWERENVVISSSSLDGTAEWAMVRVFTENLDATAAQVRRLKFEKGSSATSFTNDFAGSSPSGPNLDFEDGSVNWAAQSGDWEIVTDDADNAESGTAYLRISNTDGSTKIMRSTWRFVVTEDVVRVLFGGAMKFAAGSTATGGVFRIRYTNAAGGFVTTSTITGYVDTTNTDYGVTTLFANPPSGALFAQLEIGVVGMTAGTLYVDQCFVLRMLADSDIDALETTNGPNENNADRTGVNTAASISGQGEGATLDVAEIIVSSGSFPGTTYAGMITYREDEKQWYRRNDSDTSWELTTWDALLLANGPAEADADVTIPSSGLWTPKIQDYSYSDAEGQTYTTQSGSYARIGSNLVICHFQIVMSSVGTLRSADPVQLVGLPFTSASSGPNIVGTVNIGQAGSLNITAGHNVGGRINKSDTHAELSQWDSATGTLEFLISELSDDGSIAGTIIYAI